MICPHVSAAPTILFKPILCSLSIVLKNTAICSSKFDTENGHLKEHSHFHPPRLEDHSCLFQLLADPRGPI